MKVLIAGPDVEGLGDALDARGHEVVRIEGTVTTQALTEAGIVDADVFVLTDMTDATGIPLAKDENPDVRVVTYSRDSLPEFARGQTDLAVDPRLLDVDVVAEELAA